MDSTTASYALGFVFMYTVNLNVGPYDAEILRLYSNLLENIINYSTL